MRNSYCWLACFVCLISVIWANPECALNLDAGPCKALQPHWGHEDHDCVRFDYGGCQGNQNRFSTKALCEAACPCHLPLDSGVTCPKLLKSTVIKYGYEGGQCKTFNYKGCGGNHNRFDSPSDCNTECDYLN